MLDRLKNYRKRKMTQWAGSRRRRAEEAWLPQKDRTHERAVMEKPLRV